LIHHIRKSSEEEHHTKAQQQQPPPPQQPQQQQSQQKQAIDQVDLATAAVCEEFVVSLDEQGRSALTTLVASQPSLVLCRLLTRAVKCGAVVEA